MIIDEDTFPARTLSAVPAAEIDRNRFARYADKAEQMYIDENGMRVYHLQEITVTAQQKPPTQSIFYDYPDHSITQESMKRFTMPSILHYLTQFPGVTVNFNSNSVVIRGTETTGGTSPLLVVDDVIWGYLSGENGPENVDITMFNVSDIARIDLLNSPSTTTIFGMRGANGVIVIHTKRGEISKNELPIFHIKNIMPLGYQQPVEFYAPKYDTPQRRNVQDPDLRTTIHWQPVVQTDDTGVASFEFYTADEPTSCTVIIEGVAEDGSIIRQEGKLYE